MLMFKISFLITYFLRIIKKTIIKKFALQLDLATQIKNNSNLPNFLLQNKINGGKKIIQNIVLL
jgi:hypothetical protein